MRNTATIDLLNSKPSYLKVWFEPWAESILIPPQDFVRLIYSPPYPNSLCIEFHDDGEGVVHGVPGSSLQATLKTGEVLWEGYPTKPLPPDLR